MNYETLETLQNMLPNYNPYVQLFANVAECWQGSVDGIINFGIKFLNFRNKDAWWYNVPIVDEVGVIIVGDGNDNNFNERDIIVKAKDGRFR